MPNLNKNDLAKVIAELFKFMEKRGITLSSEKKKEITEQLTEALDDQLTKDDVKDITVQKKLLSCINAKLLGDKKDFDASLKMLAPGKTDTPDPKLDNKLKMQGAMILAAILGLKDVDNKDEKKSALLTLMMQKLKPQPKKNDKGEEKAAAKEEAQLNKDLDIYLRNLFGGINPTKSGAISFPVMEDIVSNAFGFPNQCTQDPTSTAEMVDLITFNPGKADPLGIENIAKIADLEEGVDMSEALYVSPHPSPKGMQ